MNVDRSSCTTPAPAWNRKDWAICLTLGLLALTLYCSGRNQEIQGDDDYLYVANFSMISDAILDFLPGNPGALASKLSNLAGQILCAPRHAPLPAVIHAVFYVLCHGLRIPFSMDLLHFPTGAVGAIAVSLFYALLRRFARHGRILCAAGALLLLLSPIFTMVSRGLGAYFLAFIPFTTLIALWGLLTLSRNSTPNWWVGLALAQVVVSDVIWFITLPTLLVAFIWGTENRKLSIRKLCSLKVFGPGAITVLLLLTGTWVAYHKGLATPLSKLLMEHGTKVIHGSPVIASPACPAYWASPSPFFSLWDLFYGGHPPRWTATSGRGLTPPGGRRPPVDVWIVSALPEFSFMARYFTDSPRNVCSSNCATKPICYYRSCLS
jgi:hypothetical protein